VIVVDASVALAWCFRDEQDDYADRILDRVVADGAMAPAHWPLEVANGIRSAERRGRIRREELSGVRQLLDALGIEIAPVELSTAMGTVLETAAAHDLSAYDAAYLDLAMVRDVPLATLDARLRDASHAAGAIVAE
jgi:predicted nucleic acid-binding protein